MIKARFTVQSISDIRFPQGSAHPGQVDFPEEYLQREVKLVAVYSQDPDDPNKVFWEASPNGQLSITMTKKAGAFDSFINGQTYELSFEPVAPGK